MRRVPYTDFYISVYDGEIYRDNIPNKYRDLIIAAAVVPRVAVKNWRQVLATALNYIDTLNIGGWIRNMDLRFIAFLFQETQINKIIKKLEESENNKVTIIISKRILELGFNEINLSEYDDGDIDYIRRLAEFRLKIERERG